MKDMAGGRRGGQTTRFQHGWAPGGSVAGRRRPVSLISHLPDWCSIGCAALWAASLLACSSSSQDGSGTNPGGGNGSAAGGTGSQAGGSGGGSGGVAPVSERGKACRAEVKVGEFIVQKMEGTTAPSGYVQDGVTPTAVWIERQRVGDCAVLERPIRSAIRTARLPDLRARGQLYRVASEPQRRTVTITGLSTSVSMTRMRPPSSTTSPGPSRHRATRRAPRSR